MGNDTEADHAVPIDALVALLDYIKQQTGGQQVIENWCIHILNHIGVIEGL